MPCVPDCIRDGTRPAIPQPTEWQRIGNQIDAACVFAGAAFVGVQAHQPLQCPSKGIGLRSHERNCRQHCQNLKKKAAYENEKKPRSGKINSDSYAKRTTSRVAATPARQSDRVGRASRTPRTDAFRLFDRAHLAVGACSCRQLWSTIPPRRWTNPPAAQLNLSPRQWRWLTKCTPTPSFGNRFTMTCGSNIPNGFSQMANPPCVILTRRVSSNCSTH
jgi:hypothetical protein